MELKNQNEWSNLETADFLKRDYFAICREGLRRKLVTGTIFRHTDGSRTDIRIGAGTLVPIRNISSP